MFSIFKYPLALTKGQTIRVPKRARFLSCQAQNDKPTLWAMVDQTNELEDVRIRIHGTGHPVPDPDLPFLGTVQIDGLVWHVFQVTR